MGRLIVAMLLRRRSIGRILDVMEQAGEGAMSYVKKATGDADFRGPLDVTKAATVVLDSRDTVIGWSPQAQELLGYPPGEIMGRPVGAFLSPAAGSPSGERGEGDTVAPFPERNLHEAVHRDGHRLQLVTAVCRLSGPGAADR